MDIKEKIKDALRIVVDAPRSGGSGLSIDRNTARQAFRGDETFIEILVVDVDLV